MVKIIDGSILAEKIKDKITQEIYALKGPRPNLAIILIGERADSQLYVDLKEKEAKKVGIDTHLYKCPQSITEQELLKIIKCLNDDETIDAILVQLPLPKNLATATDAIIKAINPTKDVDGFHPVNLAKLAKGCSADAVMPPVFAVVLEMLDSINCLLKDKKICLMVNSDIFGNNLANVLQCRGAQVDIATVNDSDLISKTVSADILITAVGQPRFIKKEMIKQDAIIIDVGISQQDSKVIGDVDFVDAKDKASFITPVPGGVGPLTIAMAFKNTLEIYKRRRNK
ncbi:bifunctional methylenetetrahydrofolate dehydrogenase/methenyltetrahydrofolate cyclohydrolase [Candidatus Falkowbacteria bacterium CG_4_9_14_3_um_filter_38_19]|uniref:Bifunctional protein FolD n=2 Tax=Candidatus Falkowiibacteriota TaxID=1752728 RepID=A0A2M6WS13_9BACT|nr:MAG: bifunctional methylenetetrahydrofolate dehydrogenase/methenyltetrahydrofolate cyclohydrolase [Candidatus Falkowbacteria bacterium CG10_big_fil_rev_8_21_14_0_10_38_22]PJB18009.1 MAG: bifunctional methylenetetrahydrofolate dehydrogenase/methenyltetrahydrofolate cyclohydrolase [Candidatus Falkowbacteria bacterium CG_4_9_14_3_um_filter_38_19]